MLHSGEGGSARQKWRVDWLRFQAQNLPIGRVGRLCGALPRLLVPQLKLLALRLLL